VLGCSRSEAATALDRLVVGGQATHRDEEDFRLWSPTSSCAKTSA
jgi:hypothetical protein